jgi:hypothetical protein
MKSLTLEDKLFFAGWSRGLLKMYRKLPPERGKQIKTMVKWLDDAQDTKQAKSAAKGIYNMARNWMEEE